MAGWEGLKRIIEMEVIQKSEEGCIVDGFKERVETVSDEKELMEIYEELHNLPVRSDFPFTEPNGYNEIIALTNEQREKTTSEMQKRMAALNEEAVADKFKGAWISRCIGCALGKPLERGPYMGGSEEEGQEPVPGWKHVYRWFKGADAFPIHDFTPAHSTAEKEYGLEIDTSSKSVKGNIKFMESDDDIRYTVFGLMMTEKYGKDFDRWDVGKMWHQYLTYQQVCTAETQAYLNFAHVTSHMTWEKPKDVTAQLEYTRMHLNPYREWIGAQIRVDGYAYAAAGDPQTAAKMAFTDASFSHVKNGIYGAMFCAAMIASAFVENDPMKIIEAGMTQIPTTSRLYSDIKEAIAITEKAKDQLDLVEKIWDHFNHYHCVHTNNNAALCTASLLFGNGDYDLSLGTSVLGGWDTDCNGATVGSVMGAMLGEKKIPDKWKQPFHDTLYSEIIDFHPISISECAKRSYEAWKKCGK